MSIIWCLQHTALIFNYFVTDRHHGCAGCTALEARPRDVLNIMKGKAHNVMTTIQPGVNVV